MHEAGLQLTIATVPNAPGYPGQGGFSKWMYTDWRGAYDIAALAKYVDLICLMTYDQHTRWTMPGPVAGWDWTVENLNYALKTVPKEKLSLGIPLYGYHWYTGAPTKDPATGKEKPNPTADTSARPTPCSSPRPTTAKSSGTPMTTAPTSIFTATRCANGSSSPICTPSRTATNWSSRTGCRASVPGFSAKKTPQSGISAQAAMIAIKQENGRRVQDAFI